MLIKNSSKNTFPATDLKVADTFGSRFLGLMGKKSISPGSGLLIVPCNSIHMLFMRFPIDAVFLDGANSVVYIAEGIRPWHISKIVPKAHSVLELPSGTAALTRTEVGDKLILEA
jgi:uncharacterized membrane protein (UPF0127 family)